MKDEHTYVKKMARKGRTKVIYKETFISKQSLGTYDFYLWIYSFYIFQVSPCALWGRTLRILVFNIDVNRKHRIVGQTLLDLADVDLSQGKLVSRQIGKPKVFKLLSYKKEVQTKEFLFLFLFNLILFFNINVNGKHRNFG